MLLSEIMDYLGEVMLVVCTVIYYRSFLKMKPFWSTGRLVAFMLFAALIYNRFGALGVYSFEGIDFAKTVILGGRLVFVASILLLPFEGRLTRKIFLVLSMFTLLVFSEFLVGGLAAASAGIGFENLVERYGGNGIIQELNVGLYCVIVLVIAFTRRKKATVESTASSVLVLLIFATTNTFVIVLIALAAYSQFIDPASLIFFTIGASAINIAAYLINDRLEYIRAQNHALALEAQRREIREEYYRDLETHQHEVRCIKHDLKNQLIALSAYAEEEDQEEVHRRIALISQTLDSPSGIDAGFASSTT